MLHDLGVDAIEAVGVVAIRVVMTRDLVESAAPRVIRRGSPVERRRRRGVHVIGIRAGARRERRIDGRDRHRIVGRIREGVILVRRRRGQRQPLVRTNRKAAARITLLHPVRRGRGGTVDAEAVILDLRRITPASDRAQIETPRPVTGRVLRGLDQFVALRGVQTGDAPVRAIAGEVAVTFAAREAAAAVDAFEVRIKT